MGVTLRSGRAAESVVEAPSETPSQTPVPQRRTRSAVKRASTPPKSTSQSIPDSIPHQRDTHTDAISLGDFALPNNAVLTVKLRSILGNIFSTQSSLAHSHNIPVKLGPIEHLRGVFDEDELKIYDTEQLWTQVDMRTASMLQNLQRECNEKRKEIRRLLQEYRELEKQGEKDLEAHFDDEDHDQVQADSDDSADLSAGDTDDSGISGSDDDSAEDEERDGDGEEQDDGVKVGKKVSFEVKGSEGDSEGEESEDDSKNGEYDAYKSLEDGFFKVKDLESFVDEAEALAEQGKLYESDAESDSDESDKDSETQSGSVSDESEQHSDVSSQSDSSNSDLDGKNRRKSKKKKQASYTYNDFFDPPASSKDNANRKKSLLSNADQDHAVPGGEHKTALSLQQERLKRKITKLEEQAMAEKPWQLRGEIGAAQRPKNSLLDANLEHDVAVKLAPVMTEEDTLSLEEMIKKRILENRFDNVIPKMSDQEMQDKLTKKKARSELPEISQDKSKVGLAEVYEAEYLEALQKRKAALSQSEADILQAALDAEKSGKPEYLEIHQMFKDVSEELDALSNLRFAPKPSRQLAPAEVRPNIASLAMEHATPEGISNVPLVAPGEVYSKKRSVVNEAELTKEQRAAMRNSKKKLRKKEKAAKARAKSVIVGGPTIGQQMFQLTSKNGKAGKKLNGHSGGTLVTSELGSNKRKRGDSGNDSQPKTSSGKALLSQIQATVNKDLERKRKNVESRSADVEEDRAKMAAKYKL